MERTKLVLLVFALTGTLNVSAAVSPTDMARRLEQCDRKGNPRCIGELETEALAMPGSKVKRVDNVLEIRADAKVVSFEDRANAGVQTLTHHYLGILGGAGYHVVARRGWEQGDFVLVSPASGEWFPMAAIPQVSQKATLLVSVSARECCGWNGIAVWRITPERLIREFQFSPREYALYKFTAWEGEGAIRLEKLTRASKELCPGSRSMTVGEVLKPHEQTWQLVPEMPPRVNCR